MKPTSAYNIIKSSYKNSLIYARSNDSRMIQEYKTFFEVGSKHPSMMKLMKKEAARKYTDDCIEIWALEMNKGKVIEPFLIFCDSCKAMVRLFKLRHFNKEISALNKNFQKEYNHLYPDTKYARKKIINENRISSSRVKRKRH